VMGAAGVGTIFDFADGFSQVAAIHKTKAKNTHAIINCSFSLSIPIDGHDNSSTNKTRQIYRDTHPGFKKQIDDLLVAIGKTLSEDAIIVAAAGNDSVNTPPANPPGQTGKNASTSGSASSAIDVTSAKEARYPAQFLSVIGVGALARDLNTIAKYSNKADQPPLQGIYAFGGSYEHNQARVSSIANAFGHKIEEGIIGIFTGDPRDLIPGKQDDVAPADEAEGYAEWEGTSFAAPIVSACIALLWSSNGGTRQDALDDINAECERVNRVGAGTSDETRKLKTVYQVHD
jgi:subtilisin family serine protease